jgi:hypothetical protein
MSRYNELRQKINKAGKRYFTNAILPSIPLDRNDIYLITTYSDRLDNLSYDFYGTTEYWWIIAAANPDDIKKDSFFVTPGVQIRIPYDPQGYINRFTSFNTSGR